MTAMRWDIEYSVFMTIMIFISIGVWSIVRLNIWGMLAAVCGAIMVWGMLLVDERESHSVRFWAMFAFPFFFTPAVRLQKGRDEKRARKDQRQH